MNTFTVGDFDFALPDELIAVLVDRRERHVPGGLEGCIMDPQQNHAVASSPLVKNQRSEILF